MSETEISESGTEPRPTPPAERAMAPDLARGVMLLGIALANSHYFLSGRPVRGGFPIGGSTLDAALTWLIATFVDGRAFPMFGVLFGYGVARIAARQAGLGPKGVRHLLWRRGLALVGLGFLHAELLFVGDILGAYGVLLLAGAWLVRWPDRRLLLVALAFFVLTALPSADSMSISTDPPDISMLPTDPLAMLADRAPVSLWVSTVGPVGFAAPFAIGLWAGRRRVLEQPRRHLALLRTTAVAGLVLAVAGAQPVALMLAGVTGVPGEAWLGPIGTLHDATGMLGGLGYAALLALVSLRLEAHGVEHGVEHGVGPFVRAVAAVGQRSMTCYLTQSLVWTVAFTPFLLDLSGRLTVTGVAALAVATWLGTVGLAEWLRRAGRRGPFEILVRRVTYGRI